MFPLVPGTLSRKIQIECLCDPVHVRQERVVGRRSLQNSLIHTPQQQHGIVPALLPKFMIEPAEQLDGGMIPAPAQVVGDVQQRTQSFGQRRVNFESMERLHGRPRLRVETWGALQCALEVSLRK